MKEVYRFAAMALERELKQITDRFKLVDTYDVTATDEGFRVIFMIGEKEFVNLNNQAVRFVIPYEEFDDVIANNLNVANLVRKYRPEHSQAIDTAMFSN